MKTLDDLTNQVAKFCEERDWRQFHTPKDTAMAIAVEAGELVEHFLWQTDSEKYVKENKQDVSDELADILYNVLMFSHENDIDLTKAFEEKLAKNAAKYPVEKSKGKREKYTKL